jgi:hypothetical protein
METYIVRVYRRDAHEAGGVFGTVEIVGIQRKRAFKNRDELWALLGPRDVMKRGRPTISSLKNPAASGREPTKGEDF